MRKPPELTRLDFVCRRLDSLGRDITTYFNDAPPGVSLEGSLEDMFQAIHDALRELTSEVHVIKSLGEMREPRGDARQFL